MLSVLFFSPFFGCFWGVGVCCCFTFYFFFYSVMITNVNMFSCVCRELSQQIYVSEFDPEVLDPRCLTPLDRARSKKKTPKESPKPPKRAKTEPAKVCTYSALLNFIF